MPHSKQHALNRDVINPQDGHILCDRYPAIRGCGLRILWSSRIANSAISRPKEIPTGFKKVLLSQIGGRHKPPPFFWLTPAYAALAGALASRVFSPPTLTLICLGLASAFLASLIFSTPWA